MCIQWWTYVLKSGGTTFVEGLLKNYIVLMGKFFMHMVDSLDFFLGVFFYILAPLREILILSFVILVG